ncbi:MAG TPA: hypothetical protein PK472_18000 [Pseudomonadota bacterium]|jgi:hypothetical protein|nr:hypothetical protein [Pseudomonadota bacterium]HND09873.1 hypothetical protein [Pseudomonadota bacterium]HNN51214.1 hypothetical protein [Pseudomonadota bacterium]
MSSSQPSPLSGQLDRVLAEHRAGHFGKARLLLAELEQNPDLAKTPEESHRIAELRERFRPDWFAWLLLLGGLLLFAALVATSWR